MFWVVLALIVVPLIASAVGLIARGNVPPIGDISGIELRVRDIGHHPVLVGLWSRDNWEHPGPILFYLLAIPYRLSGSRSVSLYIGALLINGSALVGMLLIARRRGGMPLFLLTAIGGGLLVRSFGPLFVRDPWNPHVPVLPFALFVFLCWTMACGDRWALPVAAGVGTFCVQTHVGYAPLVIPLLVVSAGWLLVAEIRTRRTEVGPSFRRSRIGRATFAAVGVLAVLWLPPIVEEFQHYPGNLSQVQFYFRTSNEPTAGLGAGYRVIGSQFGIPPDWLERHHALQLWSLEPQLLRSPRTPVLLIAIALAAIVLWRGRRTDARKFIAIVGAGIVLGLVAVARTFKPLYDYRLRWASVLGMLGFLLLAWTAWILIARRWPRAERRVLMPVSIAALLLLGSVNASNGAREPAPFERESNPISVLAPRVVAALPDRKGPYIIRVDAAPDPVVHGLMLALDKRGVGQKVESAIGVIGGGAPHRVWHRGQPARGVITIATGNLLDDALQHPKRRRLIGFSGATTAEQRRRAAQQLAAVRGAYRRRELSKVDYFNRSVPLLRVVQQRDLGVFFEDGAPRLP